MLPDPRFPSCKTPVSIPIAIPNGILESPKFCTNANCFRQRNDDNEKIPEKLGIQVNPNAVLPNLCTPFPFNSMSVSCVVRPDLQKIKKVL